MAKRRTVVVNGEHRRELEAARDHDRRPAVRERCAARLQIAAGQTAHAVAGHGVRQRA
jgi:hypothetical protein